MCARCYFFSVLFLIFKQVILKVFRMGVSRDDGRIKDEREGFVNGLSFNQAGKK